MITYSHFVSFGQLYHLYHIFYPLSDTLASVRKFYILKSNINLIKELKVKFMTLQAPTLLTYILTKEKINFLK